MAQQFAWTPLARKTMKQLYDTAGDYNAPCSQFDLKGNWAWRDNAPEKSQTMFLDADDNHLFKIAGDRDGQGVDDYLLLKDDDLPFRDSSAAKIKVATGFKVELVMSTDNNNYWTDNSNGLEYWTGRPALLNRQDYVRVTLEGGDYVSIDIDSEFSGIANLTIKEGGVIRSIDSPDNVNDEVRIICTRVWQWLPVQDEVQGPLEEGGTGDIDGDGVQDKDDEDPYDPDIQEEDDVDDDPPPQDNDTVYDPEDDEVVPDPDDPPQDDDDDDDDDETTTDDSSVTKALIFTIVLGLIGYLAFFYVRGGAKVVSGGEAGGE